LRTQLRDDVTARVGAVPGVAGVKGRMGEMSPDERSALMARARWRAREGAPVTEIPARTRVVAIASGKGGVGKSSVTANLAAALAGLGLTVGVLDADIWGFSIPRMLGLEGRISGERTEAGPKIIPLEAQLVATRVVDMARKGYLRVAGVIENMSAFTCDHGTSYPLFGSGGGERLAAEVGVALIGSVPLDPAVAAGGDAGSPVVLAG